MNIQLRVCCSYCVSVVAFGAMIRPFCGGRKWLCLRRYRWTLFLFDLNGFTKEDEEDESNVYSKAAFY